MLGGRKIQCFSMFLQRTEIPVPVVKRRLLRLLVDYKIIYHFERIPEKELL